jgi:hypothetical protein
VEATIVVVVNLRVRGEYRPRQIREAELVNAAAARPPQRHRFVEVSGSPELLTEGAGGFLPGVPLGRCLGMRSKDHI